MAVTRSTSLKKRRGVVADTSRAAPQTIPKQAKKRTAKPKKTPRKATEGKATPKTEIVKVPAVRQQKDPSAADNQLPLHMITIPIDVIYTLNNSAMQHFNVKAEVNTSVGTSSQSWNDSVGQEPLRRDSTANLMESSNSISSAVQFVEQTLPVNEIQMNVRHATDLEDIGVPIAKPCSHSSPTSPNKLDRDAFQDNDMNVDSLTVIEDTSQCHREAVKEEILSTNESLSESMYYSRENECEKSPVTATSKNPIDFFPNSVASLSSPASIRQKYRMNCDGVEDFPDHLSHVSDVSMLSLDPPVNGSYNAQNQSSCPNDLSRVFEPPSTLITRREFSCLFQSSNFPKNINAPEKYSKPIIDRIEERRLCASPEGAHYERMEHSNRLEHSLPNVQDDCPSPTRTIIKSELGDECLSPTRTIIKSELEEKYLSPARTIIKNESESGDDCPSPARTIIKNESESGDDCPSPARTIIKNETESGDECPSPTRTIIKNESESGDECPSPTRTIIKDECSSPTSTAFSTTKKGTNNILKEHRTSIINRRSSERSTEAVENNRTAAFMHSDKRTRRSSFDRSLDKRVNSSLKQRFYKAERWHQNSWPRRERTSNERYTATSRRSSSTKTLYRSNSKLYRLPSEIGSDRSFKERMSKRKRNCEIDSESDLQRSKMKPYLSKGISTNRNRGFQSEWSDVTPSELPERDRIESDMTHYSEPDYGWEDPPPPKLKPETIQPQSSDLGPNIHEKMQMFMGKLNSEFDLDVIDASRKELFAAIEESIAVQSTKKLNKLDQKIQKKRDDYVLKLFGSDDFESWNNDPALS